MSANICVDQNSPPPKEENVEMENLLEPTLSPKVVFTSNEQKVILKHYNYENVILHHRALKKEKYRLKIG